MKLKLIVSAITMVAAFGAGATNINREGMLDRLANAERLAESTKITQIDFRAKTNYQTIQDKASQNKYFINKQHDGEKLYIIRLIEKSVVSYTGGIKGLEVANPAIRKSGLNNAAFNSKSAASQKYSDYLDKQQNTFINKASSKLGINVSVLRFLKFFM